MTFAYNNTKNKTTGFPPHFLLFRWHGRLPIDLAFDLLNTKPKKKLPRIHGKLAKCDETMNKRNYNKKVFGQIFEPNDRVLLRNVSETGGTGKLRSYWEKEIYVVVSCDPELPIYKIKSENGNKLVKTVHKNLLLKCNNYLLTMKTLI